MKRYRLPPLSKSRRDKPTPILIGGKQPNAEVDALARRDRQRYARLAEGPACPAAPTSQPSSGRHTGAALVLFQDHGHFLFLAAIVIAFTAPAFAGQALRAGTLALEKKANDAYFAERKAWKQFAGWPETNRTCFGKNSRGSNASAIRPKYRERGARR
jgi:hypothetical protein